MCALLTRSSAASALGELPAVPATFDAGMIQPESPGIRALFYEGPPYQGKPTRIFAWMGVPPHAVGETVPGIVLVHGGLGTAFEVWVRQWMDRGYAAIAMDVCGALPVPLHANPRPRHEFSGPPGFGGFGQIANPLEDQWPYHAVQAVLRAHSLLRAQPGVDPARIGITGVSWGGFLTCLAASNDSRFAFAAPVYGCGFIEHTVFGENLRKDAGPLAQRWMDLWDPSRHLASARMPMLWVNGTNDAFFFPPPWQDSHRLVPPANKWLTLIPNLHHGQETGSTLPEVVVFADNIVTGGQPLIKIESAAQTDRAVAIRYQGHAVKAELLWTKDSGAWPERKWSKSDLTISPGTIRADIPPEADFAFINLTDDRNCTSSTELFGPLLPKPVAAREIITDETRVPPYELPDLLLDPDGKPITTADEWEQRARPVLLARFEESVYGKTLRTPVWLAHSDSADDISHAAPSDAIRITVEDESTREIFGGKAILRQARLHFRNGDHSAAFDVLVAIPSKAKSPVPVLIGLNFWGNHTTDTEPSIRIPAPVPGMEQKERGSYARRWNLEDLIDRGYAVATAFRGEIVPESKTHFTEGILSLFPENTGDHQMGAIGAWAWSLSRILDYVGSIHEIDARHATVFGHSRLGKSALWAAAQDPRFSAVFANNTGCMGAALSRRKFGETVAIITSNFPYWFSPKLPAYADRENELPVDQHQLLALIAPRPLHLGTAKEDAWGDPQGEFLALREASKIYALYGMTTDLPPQMPVADAVPVGTAVRFHQREGKHDLLPADWSAYFKTP